MTELTPAQVWALKALRGDILLFAYPWEDGVTTWHICSPGGRRHPTFWFLEPAEGKALVARGLVQATTPDFDLPRPVRFYEVTRDGRRARESQ